MTIEIRLPNTIPGWRVMPSRTRQARNAYYIDNEAVFLANMQNPDQRDRSVLSRLILGMGANPADYEYKRQIHVALPDTSVRDLDGLHLIELLQDLANRAGCLVTVRFFYGDTDNRGATGHLRSKKIILNGASAMRTLHVHVNLFTKEFFELNGDRMWYAMYSEMGLRTRDNNPFEYTPNLIKLLSVGLFHEEASHGWNTLVIIGSDGGELVETPYSVFNLEPAAPTVD